MPRVGEERLRFTEYTKTQFVPVVIYADFESILPPDREYNTRNGGAARD